MQCIRLWQYSAFAAASAAGIGQHCRAIAEGILLLCALPLLQEVVSTAEQLHALEEQTFQQWQEALLHKAAAAADDAASAAAAAAVAAAGAAAGSARAGGVGRLSFYEGRLEFWRQLWRTLEMSDLVLMIVDARWVMQ
jgi:hypothetical protein